MSSAQRFGVQKAFYCSVLDASKRLILKWSTSIGGWRLPGCTYEGQGWSSPGTVLPRALREQTGLELAAIGPQVGPLHPFREHDRPPADSSSGWGVAANYLCDLTKNRNPPGPGIRIRSFTERELIGQRIAGLDAGQDVMLAMILDALATMREPEEVVVSDEPLLGPLEGMLPPFGEFAVSNCGAYLVGMEVPRVSVWRRLTAEVRDGAVVAINQVAI